MKTVLNVANETAVDMTGLAPGIYDVKIFSSGSYPLNKTARILKVN
ncbi:MAG TPA: hypothetical protein VHE34_12160 [Puia sp.]|nr:hypothetical protein [Puia sp.]HVU95975.1 hypothetical protein [Puia sp.]